MSEIRKDPVSRRWIVISSDNEKVPCDYSYKRAVIDGSDENCPFCLKNSDKIDETIYTRKVDGEIVVRIVNNKFPALKSDIELDMFADGIYDKITGYGIHEVIIDSKDHYTPFHKIKLVEIEAVIKAMLFRYKGLKADKKLKYGLFFKNSGESAGASLQHSHMQLIATPVIPKVVLEEIISSEKYYNYKERCLFCDVIKQEMADKERVINMNESFISFVPYAPRFPFEIWIFPKEHASSFSSIRSNEIIDLAEILKDSLERLQGVFPDMPYNFVLHTTPFQNVQKKCYHWHIEIMPRLTKISGFEWGSGFYIVGTTPENAALFLRKKTNGGLSC